ncbi:hypothetical protein [Thermodesulforhabdus norvegica]|uniref:hypothetical protein n=1 Tax=Thermodesulforhabdus norvegica TaxID=39841 RepID=UPI0015A6B614|nr:hypothetical protein [Thermodesulforhabdus norvegica]
MITRDIHLRNAKPRGTSYKIRDGSGLGLYRLIYEVKQKIRVEKLTVISENHR